MSGRKKGEISELMNPSFDVKLKTTKRNKNYKIKRLAPLNNVNPSLQQSSSTNQDEVTFISSSEEYLKSLIKIDNVRKLILKILQDKYVFSYHLNQDLNKDSIIFAVKIFAKICESHVQDLKKQILEFFIIEKFQDSLKRFIKETSKEKKESNKTFWKDPQKFFYNLSAILKEVANNNFCLNDIKKVLDGLNKYAFFFEEVHNFHIEQQRKDSFQKMAKKVESPINKLEDSRKENKLDKNLPSTKDKILDNFRNIPIYFTPQELTNRPIPLQSNIVDKPYEDVEHYLDLQFKLLREDFLKELKEGIKLFTTNIDNKISDQIKFYQNVKFLAEEYDSQHHCLRVSLNLSKTAIQEYFPKHSLKHSRTFNYDSLLCFTSDNFKTFCFGEILNLLSEGHLIVRFRENFDVIDFNKEYTMVEYFIYSDTYWHILSTLKNFNESNFPLENYIIKLCPTITPPEYLQLGTFTIKNKKILPLEEWPRGLNFYNFNESQMRAFKQALTQNLAVIEGGPGTGKTYLGVNIARTLINNKRCWFENSPILVICKTTSALDAFLKGVIEFSKEVVRVSGQTNCQLLEDYNLGNKLRHYSEDLSLKESRTRLWTIKNEIEEVTKELKAINSCQGILHLGNITEIGNENLLFKKGKMQILEWLFQECIKQDSLDEFDQLLSSYKAMNKEVSENQNEAYIISLNELKAEIDQFGSDERSKELATLLKKFICLFTNLVEFSSGKIFDKPKITNVKNPLKMDSSDRWAFYFYLLQKHRSMLTEKLSRLGQKYRLNYDQNDELKTRESLRILQDSLVVGTTSMDLVRFGKIIELIKSPIVIVEQASEILEVHLVTSLTKHCKHLILIGDRQQKPRTNDYKLNITHKLGFSLLERFIKNCFPFSTLDTQYRIPANSSALVKTIHPKLEVHSSTITRTPPRGLLSDLFFINHNHPEISEGTSKKNYHEIDFLIKLAGYLINCGNRSEKITIVAPYFIQVSEFEREKSKYSHLRHIRISVLDNFQTQESDIVLMSLVRNNQDDEMGFLKGRNRISLILSRASAGLYIMGNIEQLSNSCETWMKIWKKLKNQGSIGESLPVKCPKHEGSPVYVTLGADFEDLTRQNGCNINCKEEKERVIKTML